MPLAPVGSDDLERVCAWCFKKQAPCHPVDLKNQDSVMSSSVDLGRHCITLVQKSNISKTLSTGTDIEKALKEFSWPLRKKKEKPISSTVDRYGKKQATYEESHDVSGSSAKTVCAFMLLC